MSINYTKDEHGVIAAVDSCTTQREAAEVARDFAVRFAKTLKAAKGTT